MHCLSMEHLQQSHRSTLFANSSAKRTIRLHLSGQHCPELHARSHNDNGVSRIVRRRRFVFECVVILKPTRIYTRARLHLSFTFVAFTV